MTERRYPVCGTSLDGRRADAVTCSTSCRRERDRLRRLLTGERDGRYGSRCESTTRGGVDVHVKPERHREQLVPLPDHRYPR
jgi:hypothetical protein